MLDSVGSSAIRSLGVDIANLTSRLALQIAVIEEIIGLASTLDQNTWVHNQVVDESGMSDEVYTTTIPGSEIDKLQALLAFVGSLQ